MVVGDSFGWGLDAEADERFTDLLKSKIAGYKVLAAGVSRCGLQSRDNALIDYLQQNHIPWVTFDGAEAYPGRLAAVIDRPMVSVSSRRLLKLLSENKGGQLPPGSVLEMRDQSKTGHGGSGVGEVRDQP